ncbi:replication protein P [Microbulbifer sp. 2201CG32-9]|uniref:replication protein P n=1 Tax=Microbulbifer sp. 2201CG32-9 TaxID=3232309 RepID=UPI00345C2B78
MAPSKVPTTKTSEPATAPSGTSSQTRAGPTDREKVAAVNQVFGLFKLNYHNQYSAAFPDTQTLHHAQRLWLEALAAFTPEEIMAGAKRAILQSEYLPTVHKMLKLCAAGDRGLPEARAAYREACNAPSPKAACHWSHPAVYYAGREANWFFLANNPESVAFPVFAEHYQRICARVLEGQKLAPPERLQLEDGPGEPLGKEENAQRLAALRAELGL